MPKDDMQKYFASDSNLFLHLDNAEWLKHLNKEVGKTIKYMRHINKLSLAECARISGISVEQLKRYESGEEQVNIFHLWNLSEALDCFLSDLLYDMTPYFMNLKYDDDYEDEK